MIIATLLLLSAVPAGASTPRPPSTNASPVIAADSLRGLVTDERGAPLAGVDVSVVELQIRTRTDAAGAYAFAALPAGAYTLHYRLPGFAPVTRRVQPGSVPERVALAVSTVDLPAVTVTADRGVQTGASVLSVATVGEERLRTSTSVSLAHTLESVPGVRTLSTGEQVGKPVIRGFSGSRVLVLSDGLRLEDYSWSDEDAPSVDARLAQRVEVVRGPASLLYGPDAEGGVVNVIPEALPDALNGASFTRAGAEAYFASNNTEGGLVLRAEGARGGLGWRATGIGRLAEDFRTPLGKVENTGFGAVSGELAGGFRGTWGSVTGRYTRYGGEFKLLEADAERSGTQPAEGEEEGPERKLADDRVQVSAVLPWHGLRVEPRAQWQRHSLIEVADEVNGSGTPVPGQESVQFDLLLNTLSLDLLAHHGDANALQGTVGVSGMMQHSDTRGPVPLVPDARVGNAALFAVEQRAFGRVRLLAGARGDVHSLDADANTTLALGDESRSYRAFTFNTGAVVDLGAGLSLRGNVGQAWRAPNLFELFANGPRLGEARYDIGSADLRTERNLSVEAGLRWQRARFAAEVEGYRNGVHDYLYAAPTAETRDGLRVYRYRQTDARLWGAEASAELQATRALLLRAAADMVRGEDRVAGTPLPLMPPPRALLRAELRPFAAAGRPGAIAWAEVQGVARQTRHADEELAPAAYALLDLGGGAETRAAGRRVRLDVQVSNLLDTEYRSFLSRYKEFAANPGRSVVLRAATGL
ncbi:MAG TPA: TonB-dependent receptor [Longimicrobiaceae bacterium]|nr:TonB-dependent receptor [Longimicrobiaceae bacterium]